MHASGIPYVVGRCGLGTTPRGAIAGHGGLLKLIGRADDRKLRGVHCFGDIASEVVNLGHVMLHANTGVEASSRLRSWGQETLSIFPLLPRNPAMFSHWLKRMNFVAPVLDDAAA
jgi:hypothetical protein